MASLQIFAFLLCLSTVQGTIKVLCSSDYFNVGPRIILSVPITPSDNNIFILKSFLGVFLKLLPLFISIVFLIFKDHTRGF